MLLLYHRCLNLLWYYFHFSFIGVILSQNSQHVCVMYVCVSKLLVLRFAPELNKIPCTTLHPIVILYFCIATLHTNSYQFHHVLPLIKWDTMYYSYVKWLQRWWICVCKKRLTIHLFLSPSLDNVVQQYENTIFNIKHMMFCYFWRFITTTVLGFLLYIFYVLISVILNVLFF